MSTWTKVRDTVEGFFAGSVWNFMKAFALKLESDEAPVLIAAAENAVSVGAITPGGGEVKMAAALAAFSAEVLAKGLPFVESDARALIEVQLQNVKAAATAPAVVAAATTADTPAAAVPATTTPAA